MRKNLALRALAPALLLTAWTGAAFAEPGDLDPGFGGLISTPDTSEDVRDVVVAPSGNVYVLDRASQGDNDFLVIRLDAAGSLDASFGAGGILSYAPNACLAEEDFAIAVDEPNSTIYIGGTCVESFTEAKFLVRKLNFNGSFDGTFGSGGNALFNTPDDGVILRMVRAGDGKILAVGVDANVNAFAGTVNNPTPVVVRFNSNGTVDDTFTATTLDWGTASEAPTGITLQTDGKILVGGSTDVAPIVAEDGPEFGLGAAMSRLLPNGGLDTGFANAGNFTASFAADANEALILPVHRGAGKFFITAYLDRDDDDNDQIRVLAFENDGTPDLSFGDGSGGATFDAANYLSENVPALQADGKVVLANEEPNSKEIEDVEVFRVAGYSELLGGGPDTTPDPFTFRTKRDVAAGASSRSETVTISGLSEPVDLELGGDASGRYALNGGDFTSAATTIQNGDTLQLRLTAGALGGRTNPTQMSVTVGTYTATFTVLTTIDNIPDAFNIPDVADAAPATQTRSLTRTPAGYNVPLRISVTGDASCRLQIGTAAFARRGTISPGDTLKLRVRSGPTSGDTRSCTVTFGGVSDGFTVTTD